MLSSEECFALVSKHISCDVGELAVLDVAEGNSTAIPIGWEATTYCTNEDEANLVPASLECSTLVMSAELGRFT